MHIGSTPGADRNAEGTASSTRWEGGPETSRNYCVASPADAIERPFLVVQGANDRRTLRTESDQIVAAVRKNGVPVTYLLYEGEGHGLAKRENQIEAFRATLEFLDRYVKAPR